MKTDNKQLFEEMPVTKAVISLVIPTIISQLITVIYNMADTFFIGQINDPNQVAAVSISMPVFVLLTGCANLFGIGGSSLISRSLGVGNRERAKNAAAFSIWTSTAVAFIYGILMYFLRPYILPAIGADEETYGFCMDYLFWTVTVGAIPTVLNQELAHLVRAEGFSSQASFGVALGGVLNMILDPIFIFGMKMDVAGAAIATMLSNVAATVYFIVLILKRGEATTITFSPKYYNVSGVAREVLLVGLPSCAMNIMAVFSNITLNKLMASYSNQAIAGIGVAKKVDMLMFAVAAGMSQGALPIIAYNSAAENFRRMSDSIKTTLIMSLSVSVISSLLLFTCAGPIVRAFIDDAETVRLGGIFQRIMCITGPCISLTMISITIFQSVGKKIQPLVLSFMRKGGLDIPLMYLMNNLLGLEGIVWAAPIADFCAMVAAIMLFLPFWRGLVPKMEEVEQIKEIESAGID